MRGFIVYPTYRVIDGKAYVHLYGRLENGESFLTINHYRPHFFIRLEDMDKVAKTPKINSEKLGVVSFDVEESEYRDFDGRRLAKITTDIPGAVPEIRDVFRSQGIASYEADIRFVYRFLIDCGITGSMEIKGDHIKDGHVDRLYNEPELSPAENLPDLKILSMDVETDRKASQLYSVSMYTGKHSEVFIVSKKDVAGAISFPDEKSLILAFIAKVKELDPDIITGWNLVDFDLKVLKARAKAHGIAFNIGRSDEETQIKTYDSFFKDSTADAVGRMVLDGIMLMKISLVSLPDYKLDTAAKVILGEHKVKIFNDTDKGSEIERIYKEQPERLVEYNMKDSVLVYDILQKKRLLEVTIRRSLLTGMQLDRVKASIASLDNLYLRETKRLKIVARTNEFSESEERIKGGYVKDSIPGIYDNIIVLDFKSLYPSIIRTFNIDPLTFVPNPGKDKKDLIEAPNKAYFRKEEGILPRIIQELWEKRDDAKKRKNLPESNAIKITMNSFFGVLANPMCRFYSLEMANAITSYGRFAVQTTIDLVEKMGYKVIYGDTDSIFVKSDVDSEDKAIEIGHGIAKKVNEFWEKYALDNAGRKSYMELQYEKTFIRFIMPKIRGSETGAKKRYAGIVMVDGKEQIKFTGLEFVRRDWTELSKKFQLELLDKVFHKQEVAGYVKEFLADLKKGKYDDLLVYKKAIRKDLTKYTKTTPPHVKAARKLGKEQLDSSIISYVMTVNGPEPIQKLSSNIDYEHYIEKQVKPIAESVLVFFDTKFEDLTKGSTQKSLFSFG